MALKGGDKLEAKLKSMLGKLSKGETLRVGFLEECHLPIFRRTKSGPSRILE
jgi:hypothetical protein